MTFSRITAHDASSVGATATLGVVAGAGTPATATAGRLLLIVGKTLGFGSYSVPGFTQIASDSVGGIAGFLWAKISDGTESAITVATGDGVVVGVAAAEYSGSASPYQKDGTPGHNNVTSATSCATAAISTSMPDDLIFVVCCKDGSSPGTPSWDTATLILDGDYATTRLFCGQYLPGTTVSAFTDTARSSGTANNFLTLIAGFSITSLKSLNGLARGSNKTWNGLAIASLKQWNGLP